MISNVNKTITDMTKGISALFAQNNMLINEFVLQKFIYEIKMNLGHKHSLYDKLPYYWYYYGPYSKVLSRNFKDLNQYYNQEDDNYSLNSKYSSEFLKNDTFNDFPEIIDLSYGLIEKGDYVYSGLAEDIYRKYAPYDVIYTLKYKIFDETYHETISDAKKYVKTFKECRMELLKIHSFMDFALIFSKFTAQLDLLNDDDLIAQNWNILKNPIRNLWFSFAKNLRINFHDTYYDKCHDEWTEVFKKSLLDVDEEVDAIILKTNDFIDFSKYGDYDDFDRKILNATIGNYLGDDE